MIVPEPTLEEIQQRVEELDAEVMDHQDPDHPGICVDCWLNQSTERLILNLLFIRLLIQKEMYKDAVKIATSTFTGSQQLAENLASMLSRSDLSDLVREHIEMKTGNPMRVISDDNGWIALAPEIIPDHYVEPPEP